MSFTDTKMRFSKEITISPDKLTIIPNFGNSYKKVKGGKYNPHLLYT